MNVREFIVNEKDAIAITSMSRIKQKLYLGLTGGSRVLAVFDTDTEEITVEDEIFPWVKNRGYCSKIHNSMGVLSDGSILMGEGNHFTWDGIPVAYNYLSKELPESMLYRKKILFPDANFSDYCLADLENWDRTITDTGAKLVRYYPDSGKTEIFGELPRYLYSQSMIVDNKYDRAFGHTIPDNHFFYADIKNKIIKDFGHISDYANHNMVITPDGICYGGWIDKFDGSLKLLKFDPEEERLRYLDKIILKDPGLKVAGNQGIDEWIVTSSGEIYMGSVANSLFFRFHYNEEEFELIGQLSKGGRVTSIDEDDNGKMWIGAGYPNMHLINFDPEETGKSKFMDFGKVNDKYSRCYFHASCYYNGRLYLGETDGFSPSLHVIDLKDL